MSTLEETKKRISFIHNHGQIAMAIPIHFTPHSTLDEAVFEFEHGGWEEEWIQNWIYLNIDEIEAIKTQIDNALTLAKSYKEEPNTQWSKAKINAYEHIIRGNYYKELVKFFNDRNITGEAFFEDMYVQWRDGMDSLLEQFIDETPELRMKINEYIKELKK